MVDAHQLADWLDVHMDEALSFLSDLIRIPSIKGAVESGAPFGPGPRDALSFFLSRAEQDGFSVKNVDGYAGHAEWGPSDGELIGVLAHLDVVPDGPGWTHEPFGGVRVGDQIYGRGTTDDKGPAVAAYFALRALRELHHRPRRKVRLILGIDEESGFACMRHYFAREPAPTFGFTPDADFPIVTAEKGILTVSVHYPLPAATATGPIVHRLIAGTRPNVVAAAGEVTLTVPAEARTAVAAQLAQARLPLGTRIEVEPESEDRTILRVRALGRGAHASDPAAGANAAAALLIAIGSVTELPGHDVLAALGAAGADYSGASIGADCSDAVSGPLTANLGLAEGSEGVLALTWNLRYPVTQTGAVLVERIRAHLSDLDVTVDVVADQPPLHVSPDNPFVRTLARAYEEETGQAVQYLAIGGGTYARAIPLGVAFGARFPNRPEVAHAPDEHLEIEDFRRWIKIYAQALAGLLEENDQ